MEEGLPQYKGRDCPIVPRLMFTFELSARIALRSSTEPFRFNRYAEGELPDLPIIDLPDEARNFRAHSSAAAPVIDNGGRAEPYGGARSRASAP